MTQMGKSWKVMSELWRGASQSLKKSRESAHPRVIPALLDTFPLPLARFTQAIASRRRETDFVGAPGIAAAAHGCRCRLRRSLRSVASTAAEQETLRASIVWLP